jgi:hypothetical protein
MPRPLYPRKRDQVPIVQEAGWVPRLVRTGVKNPTLPGLDTRSIHPVASRNVNVILPTVLYWCETWSVTLSDGHKSGRWGRHWSPRGSTWHDDGEHTTPPTEELHEFCSSLINITAIRSSRMRWAELVERMEEREHWEDLDVDQTIILK